MLQVLVDTVKPSFTRTAGRIRAWGSKGFDFPGPAVYIHALEVPKPTQSIPAEHIIDAGKPKSRSKLIERISVGNF